MKLSFSLAPYLAIWILLKLTPVSTRASSSPLDSYFENQGHLYQHESGRLLIAVPHHKTIVFAEDIPQVYLPEEDQYFPLREAPYFIQGRLHLSSETLNELNTQFRNHDHHFKIKPITRDPISVKLVDLNLTKSPSHTAYKMKFNHSVKVRTVWANKWLHLEFNHDIAGAQKQKIRYKTGQIKQIDVSEISGKKSHSTTTMKWETNHLVGDLTHHINQDSTEIILKFWRPGQSPNDQLAAEEARQRLKNPTKIQRVIIDPGHGGKDIGAPGLKTNEKTITLKVGLQLKKALKKAGYKALTTRDDDTFLTLAQRPSLAKKWKGDLFISLHCNSIAGNKKKKAQVKGYKIYILRETSDKKDKELAKRENKFLKDNSTSTQTISIVEWIKLEHQLNLYTKKSEDFASHIVRSFEKNKKNIRKHGSGAGQAGFYVLVGTFMPAVLVEMGFISNPQDEKYMNSTIGQKTIAKHITEAVISYEKTLK